MPQPIIEWTALEYEFRAKGVSWYWTSIILAVLLVSLAAWQSNFLFAFFIVLAEVLILVWAGREPQTVNFALSPQKLILNGRAYPLSEVAHFSVDEPEHSAWANIIFHFRRRFHPGLKIHVAKDHLDSVRAMLAISTVEIDREESFVDTLEEFLGF